MKRILTLLFLLNVSLFAHPNDIIYVFGYGELMQQALNNIAFFLENSSGLTKSALAIGVMLVGYKSIINPKASPFFTIGKTMAIFIVISGLFFYSDKGNTRYTFTIKDTSNNQTFRADGVPLGLGKMLSLVGMFEKGMVVGLETAFGSYQDEVNSFAKSGFLFPLKAKLAVNDIRLTDKNNIISNFNTYYSDCLINSGAVNEAGFIEAIMRGANEINKVCNTSQSRQGFLTKYKEDILGNTGLITGSTTQIVTCKQLCDNIKNDINTMVNDPNTVRKGLNDTLAKHFMTSGFDNNKDLQKLNKFIQNWGEAIDDSSKAYKNAVMLNLLDEAHMNKAALLGMNAKGSAFGLATAQTHAKQSFIMSGSMAGEFLPLIKAIVHIIIAIMSVFLIMLSIMFMQPMFVKTFVTLNLWIVFWSPLIAIINFIMIYNIEKVVNYVKSQGYDPFSVLGSNMLDGKILDYLAYEGTLAWLVPILAFAIASGSAQGFVAFASSLGQQFASASMMGARQVTGMATQGSQSIRDGNSVWTKDGNGLTGKSTIMDYSNKPLTITSTFDQSSGKMMKTTWENDGVKLTMSGDGEFFGKNGIANANFSSMFSNAKSLAQQKANSLVNSLKDGETITDVGAFAKQHGITESQAEQLQALQQDQRNIQSSLDESLAKSGMKAIKTEHGYEIVRAGGLGGSVGTIVGGNLSAKHGVKDSEVQAIQKALQSDMKLGNGTSVSTQQAIADTTTHAKNLSDSLTSSLTHSDAIIKEASKTSSTTLSETANSSVSASNSLNADPMNSYLNKNFHGDMRSAWDKVNAIMDRVNSGDVVGAYNMMNGSSNAMGGVGDMTSKDTVANIGSLDKLNNMFDKNNLLIDEKDRSIRIAGGSKITFNNEKDFRAGVAEAHKLLNGSSTKQITSADTLPTNRGGEAVFNELNKGKISKEHYEVLNSANNQLRDGNIKGAINTITSGLGADGKTFENNYNNLLKDKGQDAASYYVRTVASGGDIEGTNTYLYKIGYNKDKDLTLRDLQTNATINQDNYLKASEIEKAMGKFGANIENTSLQNKVDGIMNIATNMRKDF